MQTSDTVIQNALSAVAQARAFRERNMRHRSELQRRVEIATPLPAYIVRKYGGQQLTLGLDASAAGEERH